MTTKALVRSSFEVPGTFPKSYTLQVTCPAYGIYAQSTVTGMEYHDHGDAIFRDLEERVASERDRLVAQ